MNLREQEYIYAIAKNKSVTKAAKELNITQAALSLFVQNLEKKMGVQLFERYKKEMVPTYIGEIYLESANKILAEGKIFDNKLKNYMDNKQGRIRFGINSKRSPMVVPQILIKMRQEFPNVNISVKESDTRNLIMMLQKDELDCVYSYEKIDDSPYQSEILTKDYLGLAMSVMNNKLKYAQYDYKTMEYWIDLKYLDDETFLLYENDETREKFDKLAEKAGIHPEIDEYFNVETMLKLAEYNYGILYMNKMYIHNFNYINGRDVLKFLMTGQKEDGIPVYLTYHKRLLSQGYGMSFIQHIRDIHN